MSITFLLWAIEDFKKDWVRAELGDECVPDITANGWALYLTDASSRGSLHYGISLDLEVSRYICRRDKPTIHLPSLDSKEYPTWREKNKKKHKKLST